MPEPHRRTSRLTAPRPGGRGDQRALADRISPEERSDFAQVTQGAAASLLGTGVGTLSGLLITILLTRTLGVGRYGAVALAISIAAIVQALTQFGLSNGAARMIAFAHAEGDEFRALRMLKSALFVGLVAGLLGMGAMFVLGSAHVIKGFQTSTALIVMAPLVLAGALRSTLYGALRAFRDLRALVILKVAVPLIDVAAIGGLVLAGFRGVAAFAGALVAVAYVDLLLVSGFLRRGRNLGSLIDTTAADTKRLLAFSLPLVVTQLLYFGIQSLDVLLLGLLRNPVEAGLYSPVMRIMEAASKVLSAFPLLFVPVATAYVARGTPERLRELYISVTKWGYALGFPVILGVVVAPAPVLSLLFGPSYGEMDTVARVLAIGYWATLVTGLNGVSLSAVGAVKQMAWLSGAGMILNVGLALLLIGRYGPLGAAWSNTISYVSVNVAFSALLYRRTGISPFRRDSSLLFLYSGLLLALFIPLAGLPAMRATLPAMGLAVVAVAVWLVGGLFGRPFRMEWAEIRTILRPGRRGSRPSARVAPDGNGDRTLPQPADD